MHNQKKELGETIRSRREILGLLQPELATISGVSTRTIQLVENGKVNATIDTMLQIADTLGLTFELRLKDMRKNEKLP